jgi:hypothetical protein
MAVAREEHCGHIVSPRTKEHTIMEETFSVRFVPGLYKEDLPLLLCSRERGCYARTMTVRVQLKKSLVVILKELGAKRTDWQ